MKRRDFLKCVGGAAAASLLLNKASAAETRPNILWITCEDISPHLGCYGFPEATTPNLDRLASQGARYTNAFSVAGVCAPSRSCLITGMYPTTLGTQHMRCSRKPPEHVRCFPAYLRDAGYFCTNNSKTDYNFPVPDDAWDECSKTAHFRNRPRKEQPFFAVFNLTITHESKVGQLDALKWNPPKEPHDPAKAHFPPYYPDTPLIRKHWAHYYDLVTRMDKQAGAILHQLEEDGLAENTAVFWYSDHGVGLPRAKRWQYDAGIHVPFMVRWPGKLEAGSVTDRLVSFVDFGPTALSIAGVEAPAHMQGKPFLGSQEKPPRTYIHGARDRMDERYDIIRALRDKRYKYLRNYDPYRAYDQYLNYPESYPVLQEMRRLQKAGQLRGPELAFFQQQKPLEELYDLENDPHELNNLAESSELRDVLNRMRQAMDAWRRDTRDLGLVPEAELDAWIAAGGKGTATGSLPKYGVPANAPSSAQAFGKGLEQWVEALNAPDGLVRIEGARVLGLMGNAGVPVLVKALSDPEPSVAYWAAAGLGRAQPLPEEALGALEATLDHPNVSVRLAASLALVRQGHRGKAVDIAIAATQHENPPARLLAVQVLEEVGCGEERVRKALEATLEDKFRYVMRVAEHALETAP